MWFILLACAGSGDSPADGCIEETWYADLDGDGWGNDSVSACEAPEGHVANGGDCDEADATVYPAAEEQCDGLDQDCDGVADEGLPLLTQWPDTDHDGYGDVSGSRQDCAVAEGWAANQDDCDDSDGAVNPSADETCNGYDDDCDNLVDDQDLVPNPLLWSEDQDRDGFGNPEVTVASCLAPSADWSLDSGDCDDQDAEVHPGAEEACRDLVDSDCDGFADDYQGDCVGDPGWVPPATCGILPGDPANCSEGVAAFLPSGANYPTVQAAISAAGSEDVVTVCPGRWSENLTHELDTLKLAGFGGNVSVLTADGPGPILAPSSSATIALYGMGFNGAVQGAIVGSSTEMCIEASAFSGNQAIRGAAIYLYGSGTLVVIDSSFEENQVNAEYAGGLSVWGYDVWISGSTFTRNSAAYGAAVSLFNTAHAVILGSQFEANSATSQGGAVAAATDGTVEIVDSTFTGNAARDEGGGAMFSGTGQTIVLVGSDFAGNSAARGGVLQVASAGENTLLAAGSVFRGNWASARGGAVNVDANEDATNVRFAGCLFESNSAVTAGALGLYVDGGATMIASLEESTFSGNVASNEACCGAVEFALEDDTDSTLRSIGTAWDGTESDNTPKDVNVYQWEGVADFLCDYRGCD